MANAPYYHGTPTEGVEGSMYTFNTETSTRYAQNCPFNDSTSCNYATLGSMVGLLSPQGHNPNSQIPVPLYEAYNNDFRPMSGPALAGCLNNILFNGYCYRPDMVANTDDFGATFFPSSLPHTTVQGSMTMAPSPYMGIPPDASNMSQQLHFYQQLQSLRNADSVINDNNGHNGNNNDNGNNGSYNNDYRCSDGNHNYNNDNTHSRDYHNNYNYNNHNYNDDNRNNDNHNNDNHNNNNHNNNDNHNSHKHSDDYHNSRLFANDSNCIDQGISSEANLRITPVQMHASVLQGLISSTTLPQTTTSNARSRPINAKKKRKKFEEQERAKVRRVRKMGACLRCKIYKLGCDEGSPCSNCLKVKDAQRIYRGPCVRPHMDKALTFRVGDGDNGTLEPVLPTFQWPLDSDVRTVKLEWPFRTRPRDAPTFSITCQKFRPQKENLAEEYTINRVVHKVDFPPWACRDTDAAQKSVKHFMVACQSSLEDEIHDSMRDPILQLTWKEARRYRNRYKTPVLTYALQLYAGAMLNSRYPISADENVFGCITKPETPTPYFFEDLPLPPQLTFQIQTMIMLAMKQIQERMLKELKALVFARNRVHHWYEVYLTMFILLATIEWVYHIQIHFLASKEGISECNFTNISYATKHMFDKWEESAFNLIAHFRCIMHGDVPFSQSWEKGDENPRRTGLDDEALEYIRNIKQRIECQREKLENLRELKGKSRFGEPLAAVCELFLPTTK